MSQPAACLLRTFPGLLSGYKEILMDNEIIKYVIDKTTKKLKRFGICDFVNDGSFNPATEQIVEGFHAIDPVKSYIYNPSEDEFEEEA